MQKRNLLYLENLQLILCIIKKIYITMLQNSSVNLWNVYIFTDEGINYTISVKTDLKNRIDNALNNDYIMTLDTE